VPANLKRRKAEDDDVDKGAVGSCFVLCAGSHCLQVRALSFLIKLAEHKLCSQLLLKLSNYLALTCCNFSASESEALTQTPLKTDDVASLMQMIKELQDSVQPRAPTPIANWPGKFASHSILASGLGRRNV